MEIPIETQIADFNTEVSKNVFITKSGYLKTEEGHMLWHVKWINNPSEGRGYFMWGRTEEEVLSIHLEVYGKCKYDVIECKLVQAPFYKEQFNLC